MTDFQPFLIAAPQPLEDTFLSLDPERWQKTPNDFTPFWARNGITGTWNPDNVSIVDGYLRLKLVVTDNGSSITAYGAEVQSTLTYGYGTYSFRMRGASTSTTPLGVGTTPSGMISAGFNYVNNSATEIDVELQSNQPTVASLGHFKTTAVSHHEDIDTLDNLAEAFHDYTFIWTADRIEFYIDGELAKTTTQDIPTDNAYIMFNLWPTNSNDFGGETVQSGSYYMYVDKVSYSPSTTLPVDTSVAKQFYPVKPGTSGGGGGDGYAFTTKISSNSKTSLDQWNTYRYGLTYMATFDQTGWPINAGTIVTDNSMVDAAFTKQFAYAASGTEVYLRSGLAGGGWSEWKDITEEPEQMVTKLDSNSKLPSELWNTYGYGISYMAYFQNTEPSPLWPTSSGTIITENLMVDAKYASQTFKPTDSNTLYVRRVNPDNTWSDWSEMGGSTSSGTGTAKEAILQNRTAKGMITFLMDDGFVEDYTVMLPMLKAKGYPGVVAAISTYVDNPDPTRLSVAQMQDLQDKEGWEIASHTVTHPFLANLTPAQAEMELSESKKTLESVGLKVTNFVYPYGSHNATTRSLVRKYYRSAFDVNPGVNQMPLQQMTIYRVPMGSFVTSPNDTAAYYKSWVDRAKNEGGWVVFLLHTGPNQQSAQQTAYIQETVDYIAAQGVPVVTAEYALDQMGNNLDAGDYPTGNYTVVAGDGKLYSTDVAGLISKVPQQTYNNASPASAFPLGKTFMVVGGADNGGFPTDVGTLEVMKFHADNSFTRQTFYYYNSIRKFERSWIDGAWSAWTEVLAPTASKVQPNAIRTVDFGVIPAGSFSQVVIPWPSGLAYGDNVVANPLYGLESLFTWNYWVKPGATDGQIIIRAYNRSGVDVAPTTQDWSITVIKI